MRSGMSRWFAGALLLCGTLGVSGCFGSGGPSATSGTAPPSADGTGITVKQIKDAGVLRVGTWLQYKPEMWRDRKSGAIKGFWIDMARKLGADLHVKVKFIDSDFDGLIPGLQAGKWDIVLAQMAITSERALAADFGKPWEAVGIVAVLPAKSQCVTVACLNASSKSIATEVGSVDQEVYKRYFPKAKEVANKQHNDGFLQVQSGRADAFLTDNISAKLWDTEHPGSVQIMDGGTTFLQAFPTGPAYPQGSDDFANWVNIWLEDQINNGTYEKLYRRDVGFAPALQALLTARGGYS